MPIEFAPPQVDSGTLNIAPVQYTDPLQTLAQMSQLRTQGLQQQTAQIGLQEAQIKMDSHRAMLNAFTQGGGDPDKTYQAAIQSGRVLPEDLTALQTHILTMRKDAAALNQAQRTQFNANLDAYHGLLEVVTDQAGMDAANQEAQRRGLLTPVSPQMSFTPLTQFTDPTHLTAYLNGLEGHQKILEDASKQAQTTEATAKGAQATAEAGKLTTEQQLTQHKIDLYNTLQANPDALAKRIAGSVDPVRYPDLYTSALNEARNQPDIEGINKVALDYAKQIA